MNHWVRLHAADVPDWLVGDFTAIDAHARDVQTWSGGDAASFVRGYERRAGRAVRGAPAEDEAPDARYEREGSVGSNAWAVSGTRTTTGHAILLRNPHLSWDAGYYEAHVRVPGVIDFYGDFRMGGAFGIIGGFNRHLGWATTNNYTTYSQVYALQEHPELEDYAVLDGAPVALDRRTTTVEYRRADGGVAAETRFTWWTPFGPVIHRADGKIFVLKDPRDGEYRRGEQFLKMMLAETSEEWLDVMRMRAHSSSNFTYADAAGNIMMYYNARLPALPHGPTGDTAAVARTSADIWSELTPWEDLPLYVNPPGGYVLQSNDTPDFINLGVTMDRDTIVPNLPEPRFRLRSQLSAALIGDGRTLSLEDVVELKHSPRMLLAERVLDDLIAAAEAAPDARDLNGAVDVLRRWDRTAAAGSRGGVLFKYWAQRFLRLDEQTAFREPWTAARPSETPGGIADTEGALTALREALVALREDGIRPDARWGDVHRVVRGDVDVPVSGCEGVFGCFRTLSFGATGDGRFAARSGDGWVLAVEFAPQPRALSVLAYGQSPLEDSPHHADQAAMFARGEMKPVAWSDADIERAAIRRYRPGGESSGRSANQSNAADSS